MDEDYGNRWRRFGERHRDLGQGGHRRGHSPASGFFFGTLIIIVGVLMLLRNLGIIQGDLWEYWPLALVALGLFKIIECKGRPAGTMFGLIIAGAGALLFLRRTGHLDFDPQLLWPLAVIAFGVVLLTRGLERRHYSPTDGVPPQVSEATVSQWTVFGGSKRVIDSKDFRAADLFAVFGGIEADLRQATMAAEQAVLDVTAIFGGIEIKVPPTWSVVMKGAGIFGGYEDETVHPPAGQIDTAPKLIVTGFAVFGGVTVKN